MSRFREMNSDSSPVAYRVTQETRQESCIGMTTVPRPDITSGTYVPKSQHRTMLDVVTPEFNRLRSEGKVICSPMTQTDDVVLDDQASYSAYYGTDKYDCSPTRRIVNYAWMEEGKAPSSFFLTRYSITQAVALDYDPQPIIDQAVSKAWSNASLDEAMALVIGAEMGKSIMSLKQILRRLIKIGRALRDLEGKDFKYLLQQGTFKELADRWMEMRYAIRPMLYDVAGVMSALQKAGNDTNTRQTFRGHKSDYVYDHSQSEEVKLLTFSYGGSWDIYGSINKTATYSVDCRAGVLAAIQTLSKLPYWGVYHPVEAMWELVPYSFVIDWVLNVGDVLSAWTPEVGLKTLASWYVLTQQHVESVQLFDTHLEATTVPYPVTGYHFSITGCSYTDVSTVKNRIIDPSRPILPSVALRLDGFKLIDLVVMAKNLFYH